MFKLKNLAAAQFGRIDICVKGKIPRWKRRGEEGIWKIKMKMKLMTWISHKQYSRERTKDTLSIAVIWKFHPVSFDSTYPLLFQQ